MRSGRPRVVVVGSVNLDVVAELAHFPAPGETLVADRVRRNVGGKGANQAVAAAVAGADVHLVARVGMDPTGDLLVDGLVRRGVGTAHVRPVAGADSGTAYVCTAGGENTIVLTGGANRSWAGFDPAERDLVAGADVVVCQLEVPEEVVAWAAEHARGRFVLNAAPARPVPDTLLARCDPLVVNEHELAALTGREVTGPRDAVAGHRDLRDRGVRSVVTTLGGQGSVWTGPSGSGHQPALRTEVVDTTGAGDAFVGQLATRLATDPDLPRAVAAATAASGLSVRRRGTHDAYPDQAEVERAEAGLPAATALR